MEEIDLAFDENGLVPVVAQADETGEVLMLAYATAEAIERTAETGLAHYYSRSRDELWQKGGTSGHVQRVREVRVDCDADAVLYLVEQVGGACHTGYRSCFFRAVEDVTTGGEGEATLAVEDVGTRVFDPESVYE